MTCSNIAVFAFKGALDGALFCLWYVLIVEVLGVFGTVLGQKDTCRHR